MTVANMQNGRAFVFAIEDGDSPVSYTTIAGMVQTDMAVANNHPDVTNKDSAGKQEFKAGAGNQSKVITAAGRYVHADVHDRLENAANNGTEINGKITWGNGDTEELSCVIQDYQRTGPDGDAEGFSCTIARTGTSSVTRA